ncbi:MAG: hypothetical protein A2X94_13875 [Bdellovibrionales bacterium GWB1_55_8]|nr:MAG: hypothetical protein A2X94_13875 [Bdellovibrionales bacterium GWB1_55_8]
MVDLLLNKAPKTEVEMRTYGPYVSQFAWDLYRTIDWTHVHHDQTYSILSEPSIPWNKKREWTDKAVRHYLEKFDLPRSPAPLDVTMRRAGTMMKPYFGYFRTHYPQSNSYFYVAHWWHPAIYEAQMIGGNDQEQEKAIQQAEANLPLALSMRPQRMLLSREIMPRYSALSPESANIFDNLHMLHGIAYDILTYPHWTPAQKKTELDRVIRAMSYQPGDEKLARKFRTPRHDMDPRRYEPWMISVEGEMNRIMVEMMNEMMPHIMPKATRKMKKDAMAQLWQKLTPGLQDGEPPGSFHDALLKISPRMVMMSGTMEPGESNPIMMQTMMKGWTEKYAMLPELPRMAMTREPSLKSLQMAGMVNTSESKEAQK